MTNIDNRLRPLYFRSMNALITKPCVLWCQWSWSRLIQVMAGCLVALIPESMLSKFRHWRWRNRDYFVNVSSQWETTSLFSVVSPRLAACTKWFVGQYQCSYLWHILMSESHKYPWTDDITTKTYMCSKAVCISYVIYHIYKWSDAAKTGVNGVAFMHNKMGYVREGRTSDSSLSTEHNVD